MGRPSSSPAQAASVAPLPPRTPSARARTLVFGYQGRQRVWLTMGLLFLVAGGITGVGLGGGALLELAFDVRLAFFAVFFVGLVITLVVHRWNRREIRAFVHGAATRGRVVRREHAGSLAIDKKRPWRVGWEFEVGGQRYRGEISSLDQEALEAAIPTDDVVVLFDPRRPERNTVYVE